MDFVVLPNGNAVRADQVRSVRAIGITVSAVPNAPVINPRVLVDHGEGCCEICYTATFEEACKVRDGILEEVRRILKESQIDDFQEPRLVGPED